MQRPGIQDRGLELLFAAFAAVACLFAFVGLARSGYWTDELFTLFVVGHHGGLGEVWRRALTDTHPPVYYFALYEWSQVFGLSEPALRIPSAVCAVAAAGVFYFGFKGVFSPTARAFALAISLNSPFWFDQAQNARSYSIFMMMSALYLVLALAARRQARAGRRPIWPVLGLMAAGLVGSFCHAYLFLETGLVYLFLVATVPSTPLRAALVAWGLVIAGLDAVFVHILLQHTLQDVHHMWFRADPLFFFDQITVAWRNSYSVVGALLIVVLAVSSWRRFRAGVLPADAGAGERDWVGLLTAFGHFGMIGLGVAISLALAPSLSSINLAGAAPLLWGLMAWLYDLGGPRLQTRGGQVLALLLVVIAAIHTPILAGRFLVRTEDWRGTARFVAGAGACAGKPIPVVAPARFGPDTPFFRTLYEQSFYGRYFPDPARLHAYSAAELTGAKPSPGLAALIDARESGADPCPVLAWAVHDLWPWDAEALRVQLGRRPGSSPAPVEIRRFTYASHEEVAYSQWPGAFVYLARPIMKPPRGPR